MFIQSIFYGKLKERILLCMLQVHNIVVTSPDPAIHAENIYFFFALIIFIINLFLKHEKLAVGW